ncbi:peptidoglycan DD-metalloendopeptidase family protein [Candidatus Schneideria nysicola]|nr:peptidoglycan DD-metalloendopeptidase family protein [Candidatus Schneideria nysicola]
MAKEKVVYTGNALCGYGKLIIIKHENNYLSTYAHNDTLFSKWVVLGHIQ